MRTLGAVFALRQRPRRSGTPAVRNKRIVEIKSPVILQPGPAALTDGLDAGLDAITPSPPRTIPR
jgi:iron complex transport system substrate-binding protein